MSKLKHILTTIVTMLFVFIIVSLVVSNVSAQEQGQDRCNKVIKQVVQNPTDYKDNIYVILDKESMYYIVEELYLNNDHLQTPLSSLKNLEAIVYIQDISWIHFIDENFCVMDPLVELNGEEFSEIIKNLSVKDEPVEEREAHRG